MDNSPIKMSVGRDYRSGNTYEYVIYHRKTMLIRLTPTPTAPIL